MSCSADSTEKQTFPGAAGSAGSQAWHRLQAELEKIRPNEAELRARWIRDEAEGWRKLPPRAWPEYQPKAEEVPDLRAKLEAERCPPANTLGLSRPCIKATFDLASGLVFGNVNATEGLGYYRGLAGGGDIDSMVAVGVCLTEGIGIDRDEKDGLNWLQRASSLDSAQAHYEVATLMFMGTAEVEEDEPGAFALFEKAAAKDHASGMFMVADCLLEGVGCEPDAAKAVPLLLAAAEKGHRGARQHLRQLLDGQWVGFSPQ